MAEITENSDTVSTWLDYSSAYEPSQRSLISLLQLHKRIQSARPEEC